MLRGLPMGDFCLGCLYCVGFRVGVSWPVGWMIWILL